MKKITQTKYEDILKETKYKPKNDIK